MSEKVRKLENDSEYLEVFLDKSEIAEQKLSSVKTENDYLSGRDCSVPEEKRIIDAVFLADHIWKIAKERHPENKTLQQLMGIYEKIAEAFESFNALNDRHHTDYEEHFSAIEELKAALSVKRYPKTALQEAESILSGIREEIINSDVSGILFVPSFQTLVYTRNIDGHLRGEIMMKGEDPARSGNFVVINADEEIRLHKIPFALGARLWNIFSACSENLFELRNVRLKAKAVQHRDTGKPILIWSLLPAQTYKDAEERLEVVPKKLALESEEKEKYRLEDERPEIINLERERQITITEHSSFGAALLGLESDSLEGMVEKMAAIGKEKIGQLMAVLFENGGDDAERKFFGHAPKGRGKRPGLGFPGGGTEPDKYGEVTDRDILRIFPEKIAKQALESEDDFLLKILGHKIREFENESGYRVLKTYGRIARVPKGRNHVDHFWLISCSKEAILPIKELHEGKGAVLMSLNDLYRLANEGYSGVSIKNNPPYFWHIWSLAKFFERYHLPMFEEMKEFLKKVKIKK